MNPRAVSLIVLAVAWAGCAPPPPADPSLDPKSAKVDPSQVKPVTEKVSQRAEQASGKQAPVFTLVASDDKAYSEKDLKGKPRLIYFINVDCPCCVDANPFFEALSKAYPGQVLAIAEANLDQTKVWAKANQASYPILADADAVALKGFKAHYGVNSALVDGTGYVLKMFPGYSRDDLAEMSDFLSMGQAKKLDFADAPVDSATGCEFAWSKATK